LTLIVNRRPCWQPNLIAIPSKKAASGISPVEYPQTYDGITERVGLETALRY